ncbi:hypothetical protein [Oleiagrimonas sp.]|uniref:hypothetical protein n=1 Tax=Oleiagrimonas sp. TaxID=2010330 RepID=UPI002614C176|nr:hypothetical protein [Oleiagrimonas sp.]
MMLRQMDAMAFHLVGTEKLVTKCGFRLYSPWTVALEALSQSPTKKIDKRM